MFTVTVGQGGKRNIDSGRRNSSALARKKKRSFVDDDESELADYEKAFLGDYEDPSARAPHPRHSSNQRSFTITRPRTQPRARPLDNSPASGSTAPYSPPAAAAQRTKRGRGFEQPPRKRKNGGGGGSEDAKTISISAQKKKRVATSDVGRAAAATRKKPAAPDIRILGAAGGASGRRRPITVQRSSAASRAHQSKTSISADVTSTSRLQARANRFKNSSTNLTSGTRNAGSSKALQPPKQVKRSLLSKEPFVVHSNVQKRSISNLNSSPDGRFTITRDIRSPEPDRGLVLHRKPRKVSATKKQVVYIVDDEHDEERDKDGENRWADDEDIGVDDEEVNAYGEEGGDENHDEWVEDGGHEIPDRSTRTSAKAQARAKKNTAPAAARRSASSGDESGGGSASTSTVLIRNLPLNITERDLLLDFLGPDVDVITAEVHRLPSGVSRGTAELVLSSVDEARAVIESNRNIELQGRRVRFTLLPGGNSNSTSVSSQSVRPPSKAPRGSSQTSKRLSKSSTNVAKKNGANGIGSFQVRGRGATRGAAVRAGDKKAAGRLGAPAKRRKNEQVRSPLQVQRIQSRIVSPRDDNNEDDEEDEEEEFEDDVVTASVSYSASKQGKSKHDGASRTNKRETARGSVPSASSKKQKPVLLREEKKPASSTKRPTLSERFRHMKGQDDFDW